MILPARFLFCSQLPQFQNTANNFLQSPEQESNLLSLIVPYRCFRLGGGFSSHTTVKPKCTPRPTESRGAWNIQSVLFNLSCFGLLQRHERAYCSFSSSFLRLPRRSSNAPNAAARAPRMPPFISVDWAGAAARGVASSAISSRDISTPSVSACAPS